MTPSTLIQYQKQARDANNSAWVLAVDKFITEIQGLQILLAWEAGKLTEGQVYRRLKQYGGCSGIVEARELKREATQAGKGLAWPKLHPELYPELIEGLDEGPLGVKE